MIITRRHALALSGGAALAGAFPGGLALAKNDPAHLLAMPNRLMVSQPALLKLKEGLVTTQLKVSLLLGQMSEKHPQVMAAREEEREIAQCLNEEVSVALRGVVVRSQPQAGGSASGSDRAAGGEASSQGIRSADGAAGAGAGTLASGVAGGRWRWRGGRSTNRSEAQVESGR